MRAAPRQLLAVVRHASRHHPAQLLVKRRVEVLGCARRVLAGRQQLTRQLRRDGPAPDCRLSAVAAQLTTLARL
eukprot:4847477-Prymnesium_polylepis.1